MKDRNETVNDSRTIRPVNLRPESALLVFQSSAAETFVLTGKSVGRV